MCKICAFSPKKTFHNDRFFFIFFLHILKIQVCYGPLLLIGFSAHLVPEDERMSTLKRDQLQKESIVFLPSFFKRGMLVSMEVTILSFPYLPTCTFKIKHSHRVHVGCLMLVFGGVVYNKILYCVVL